MSDQINQIQAKFNAAEDRILLTIKMLNEQVYLTWVTRRFLTLLLPALQGKHPSTGKGFFDERTSLIHQAQQEKVQVNGDYDTAYLKPKSPKYPLGLEPILLTKITFKALNTTQAQLILEPTMGRGVYLPFNPKIVGAMLKIFTQSIEQADWKIVIEPILSLPKNGRLQ